MVDTKKIIKGAAGGVLLAAGVAAKLSDKALSVAKVVFSGAANMADMFAKAPKGNIGESFFSISHKALSKISDKLLKKGKEMF